MSEAKLDSPGGGRFSISGVLDASTVTDILRRSEEAFAGQPVIEIDLGGVTESDSSGLALLIEWLRRARNERQKIVFLNVPRQISALARISEVEDLIATNGADSSKQIAAAAS